MKRFGIFISLSGPQQPLKRSGGSMAFEMFRGVAQAFILSEHMSNGAIWIDFKAIIKDAHRFCLSGGSELVKRRYGAPNLVEFWACVEFV